MNIIGICGHAGSGKDTAADFLVAKGYQKISLADPLKRICADVFRFSREQLWGPSENRNRQDMRYPYRYDKALGLTPRYALQRLGTEWGRDCYDDIWIEYAIRMARAVLEGEAPGGGFWYYRPEMGLWGDGKAPKSDCPAGVVIPDVRFANEVAAIQQAGGRVIRLLRPRSDGAVRGGIPGHASEAEQDRLPAELFHATIHNTGTLEDLKRDVLEVVRLP
ncbi:MAG: hypothetical protein KJ648_07330 [Candidatus Omnitrophica bacterium]|nr:hypothetical protein [Candidatus Omnitrophota bacterium]